MREQQPSDIPRPWKFGTETELADWEQMFDSLVVAFRYAESLPTAEEQDEAIAEIQSYAARMADMPPGVSDEIYKQSLIYGNDSKTEEER